MRSLVAKWTCLVIFGGFLLFGITKNSWSYEESPNIDRLELAGASPEIEFEYYLPVETARDIDTLTLNLLKEFSHKGPATFYYGLTITQAWGDSTHLGIVYGNSVIGVGPDYLIRYKLGQWKQSLLSLDMSGALIVYNEPFPAGGDFYNFMWRIGPKFTSLISDNCLLSFGLKIMHVSNGQWSNSAETSHNPAYNAAGFSISITKLF